MAKSDICSQSFNIYMNNLKKKKKVLHVKVLMYLLPITHKHQTALLLVNMGSSHATVIGQEERPTSSSLADSVVLSPPSTSLLWTIEGC